MLGYVRFIQGRKVDGRDSRTTITCIRVAVVSNSTTSTVTLIVIVICLHMHESISQCDEYLDHVYETTLPTTANHYIRETTITCNSQAKIV